MRTAAFLLVLALTAASQQVVHATYWVDAHANSNGNAYWSGNTPQPTNSNINNMNTHKQQGANTNNIKQAPIPKPQQSPSTNTHKGSVPWTFSPAGWGQYVPGSLVPPNINRYPSKPSGSPKPIVSTAPTRCPPAASSKAPVASKPAKLPTPTTATPTTPTTTPMTSMKPTLTPVTTPSIGSSSGSDDSDDNAGAGTDAFTTPTRRPSAPQQRPQAPVATSPASNATLVPTTAPVATPTPTLATLSPSVTPAATPASLTPVPTTAVPPTPVPLTPEPTSAAPTTLAPTPPPTTLAPSPPITTQAPVPVSTLPTSNWPIATGVVQLTAPRVIAAGEVFDGGMKSFERSNVVCNPTKALVPDDVVFIVQAGGTLLNAIVGANQVAGVYCAENKCTLVNVWHDAVCQAAVVVATGAGTMTITGGGAKAATARVVLAKAAGTVTISGGFSMDTCGLLYESCATCGPVKRQVVVDGIVAVNPTTTDLVRVNRNYKDEATIVKATIVTAGAPAAYKVCTYYDGGKVPVVVGAGADPTLCQYTAAGVTITSI